MLHNVVGLPGQQFHLEKTELGVDRVEFVDYSTDISVFLFSNIERVLFV